MEDNDILLFLEQEIILPFSSFINTAEIMNAGYYSINNIDDGCNLCYLADDIGSEQFAEILFSIVYDGLKIDIDEVIDNKNLLPNEKVSLVFVSCLQNTDIQTKSAVAVTDCELAWREGKEYCNRKNIIEVATASAIALINPYLGALCMIAAAADNDTCNYNMDLSKIECENAQ
ncbi:MAG: hypothetical protein HUJ92_00365 [Bacteroidales bacterium]|nr:hypothetical protein [Bacteroidales bacterium]